jgi:hypothetical protein
VFYLGTHMPGWLTLTQVPLFINRTRIKAKRLPRAIGRWALDSGAFSELTLHNRWSIGAREYAKEVRRFYDEIGNMDWASIQDWMCEAHMLKKTGKSIKEHQALTVQSAIDLRSIDPTLPWVPVLQGFLESEYLDHVEQYMRAGIDLTREPVVGLGSVCRRQGTVEFVAIVKRLTALGLSLHGFGVKTQGLQPVAALLKSSDSLAWSRRARWIGKPALPQCSGHVHCGNCLPFALHWRAELLRTLPPMWQDNPPADVDVLGHRLAARLDVPYDELVAA